MTAGAGGNPTGIGDYVRSLDSAGIPAVVMCNDGMTGVLDAINTGMTTPHVLAYRVVRDGSEAYAVPDYNQLPKIAAERHWAKIYEFFPDELKEHRDKIWILPINEVDKNRSDWLGWFGVELATIANADGYKVSMFGWSSGEPEPDHWKTDGMRAYLELCELRPELCSVCLHEYSYTVDNIFDQFPYKVGRFKFLFNACDEMDIKRPNVLIGEWGWTYDDVPPIERAIDDIYHVSEIYGQYPEILGAALWYLGPYQNIANEAQKLIEPVTEMTLNTYWNITEPEVPTEPTMPTEEKKDTKYIDLPVGAKNTTVSIRVEDADGNPYYEDFTTRLQYAKSNNPHKMKLVTRYDVEVTDPVNPEAEAVGVDVSKWQGSVNWVKMAQDRQ